MLSVPVPSATVRTALKVRKRSRFIDTHEASETGSIGLTHEGSETGSIGLTLVPCADGTVKARIHVTPPFGPKPRDHLGGIVYLHDRDMVVAAIVSPKVGQERGKVHVLMSGIDMITSGRLHVLCHDLPSGMHPYPVDADEPGSNEDGRVLAAFMRPALRHQMARLQAEDEYEFAPNSLTDGGDGGGLPRVLLSLGTALPTGPVPQPGMNGLVLLGKHAVVVRSYSDERNEPTAFAVKPLSMMQTLGVLTEEEAASRPPTRAEYESFAQKAALCLVDCEVFPPPTPAQYEAFQYAAPALRHLASCGPFADPPPSPAAATDDASAEVSGAARTRPIAAPRPPPLTRANRPRRQPGPCRLSSPPAQPAEPLEGSIVFIHGLTSEAGKEMNGKRGAVLSWIPEKRRYEVSLLDGHAHLIVGAPKSGPGHVGRKVVSLKAANLKVDPKAVVVMAEASDLEYTNHTDEVAKMLERDSLAEMAGKVARATAAGDDYRAQIGIDAIRQKMPSFSGLAEEASRALLAQMRAGRLAECVVGAMHAFPGVYDLQVTPFPSSHALPFPPYCIPPLPPPPPPLADAWRGGPRPDCTRGGNGGLRGRRGRTRGDRPRDAPHRVERRRHGRDEGR